MKYYPVQLYLNKKPVLVIGGGQIATRKVATLLKAGARITVVSPEITNALHELVKAGEISWVNRELKEVDLGSVLLVFAATSNAEVNREVATMCRKRRILCNIVDNAEICDFILPSIVEKKDLMFTISTGGKAPFLAKKIKEELEGLFDERFAELIEIVAIKRREYIRSGQSLMVEKMAQISLSEWREAIRFRSKSDMLNWIDNKLEKGVA